VNEETSPRSGRKSSLARTAWLGICIVIAASALLLLRGDYGVHAQSTTPPVPQFISAPNVLIGFQPGQTALADIDGDGKLDLIVSSGLQVYLGKGDGTFQSTPVSISTSCNVGAFAVGDINGDGKPDLVVTDGCGSVEVFANNSTPGSVAFSPAGSYSVGLYTGTTVPVYLADMNGDGYPDILLPASSNGPNPGINILLNNFGGVPGTFGNASVVSAASNFNGLLAIGNFVHGGLTDLALGLTSYIAGTGETNSIEILVNNTSPGATTLNITAAATIPLTLSTNTNALGLRGLIAADFGNGNLDLMASEPGRAGAGAGTLYFLEGDGTGNFSTPQVLPNQAGGAIASVDINGDGMPDVAIGNGNDGFTALINQGITSGLISFPSSPVNYVAGQYPGMPVVGDLNGDSFADLVIGTGGGVSVFLNNKGGGFQGSRSYPAGSQPASIGTQGIITLHNFFASGASGGTDVDTAVMNPQTDSITVLGTPASGPNGTLTQSATFGPFSTSATEQVTAITGGCLNGLLNQPGPCLGYSFVAAATFDSASGTAKVQVITGAQNYQPVTVPLPTSLAGQQVQAMAAGEFYIPTGSETDLALAVSNGGGAGTLVVLIGGSNGTFLNPVTFPLGNGPAALIAADFNGDGLSDIAVLNVQDNPSDIGVLLNTEQSGFPLTFHSMATYPISGVSAYPNSFTAGDFNHDGHPDIAVVSSNVQEVDVLLNQGTGTFATETPQQFLGLTGAVTAGDFNGDGIPDLAVTNGASLGSQCNVNDAAVLLVGNGDGTFGPNSACGLQTTGYLFPVGAGPYGIAAADFNADGKLDLAVADGNGNMVTLLLSGSPSVLASSKVSLTGPTSATYGQSVTFTATVSAASGTGTPTGTVTFSNGATALGTVSLSGNTASFTTSTLPAGSLLISAVYNGDSNFAPSQPVTAPITISAPLPPATVTDNETISVSDAETFPDIADNEKITVSDAISVVPLTLSPPIGVAAPVAYFSVGSPLGFGSQSQTQRTAAISNIGQSGTTLTLGSVTISSGAPFALSPLACFNGATSTTIPSGGFCTVTITYTGSAPTTDTGTLLFTDNAALSNLASTPSGSNYTQSIVLTGSGTSTPPPAAPPAVIPVSDNETITVSDAVTFPDIFDAEKITVSDAAIVLACVPNVSSQFSFAHTTPFFYPNGTAQETITLTNKGATAVTGPIYVVVNPSNLPVANKTGTTACNLPGSAYLTVSSGTLGAGQSLRFALQFTDPGHLLPSYLITTFAGSGTP
jgi:hypothetical protein